MNRFRLIALTAVVWTTALSATYAEHGGRPANVPGPPGSTFYYIDGSGAVRASEGSGGFGVLIFGWSFDPSDPDSSFESSSPNFTSSNTTFTGSSLIYAYNGSVINLDQINVEALNQNPNFNVGPNSINMLDSSTLNVTNSIILHVAANDSSNVNISDTQVNGDFQMQSEGAMKLNAVTILNDPFSSLPHGNVNARAGTTDIVSSTIQGLSAFGSGTKVTVVSSTIKGGVSCLSSEDTHNPSVSLIGTPVGKLQANVGSINMVGGEVKGIVEALGNGTISVSSGSILGNATAFDDGKLTFTGTTIAGNLSVGDPSSGNISQINVSGGSIAGAVQAVGSGELVVQGASSLNSGLQSHQNASLTVTDAVVIHGDVYALGDSTMKLESIGDIAGNVIAYEKATIDLNHVDVSFVGAFDDATVRMADGSAFQAFANGGNLSLTNVAVSESVAAYRNGHLTFGAGSSAGKSITNFGDVTGLVSVQGGNVAGNLIGSGSSITAMSGGHVVGSPIFREQALFVYFGGTFGFLDIPPDGAAASLRGLAGGASGDGCDDGEDGCEPPQPSQLPGFTIFDDAEIQFFGFGLQSTLIDPDFTDGALSYSVYQLTGRLADGSIIDGGSVYVQNLTNARFLLIEATVPEPASIALLSFAFLPLTLSRRRIVRR